MKRIAIYCIAFLFASPAFSQYYLRGSVRDQKNVPLSGAQIFVHSIRTYYNTGAYGGFGFPVNKLYDSLTITMDGYEPRTMRIKTDVWQDIVLRISVATENKNKPKLISVTKDLKQDNRFSLSISNETYFQLVENQFVKASEYPNTGFSLNVNKASYSNVRRFLNMRSIVPPDAVRVEEMVNYFNLHTQSVPGNDLFALNSQLTSCPWNAAQQLLLLEVNARRVPLENIPPSSFVFLIDVSGSMDMPNKLPLLQAAFQSFITNLRDIDTMSIVTYGGSVNVWLPPTGGANKEKIRRAVETIAPGGDTPGEAGIRAAYQLAKSSFIPNGNNRVILATDGDFNVGESSERALDELITQERQSGVYLTCLGVGVGNFKDSKLQTLAKKGNGNYAYLDDIQEAEKVLVKELTQTLYSVADNVAMNVRFNPALVKTYRLIGFDNKKDALQDASTGLEGGEIGSGSNTVAIFEIEPTDLNVMSRYQPFIDSLAVIELQYSLCQDTSVNIIRKVIPHNYIAIDSIPNAYGLAATITAFGLKLRSSPATKNYPWQTVKEQAMKYVDKNDYLQQELISQIDKAIAIYDPGKKKKKKKRI